MDSKVSFDLSKDHTLILKGVAIVAMLWHHLFTTPLSLFNGGIEALPDFNSVTVFFGGLGKVCVSIFLFLSGYGLTVQFSKVYERTTGYKSGIANALLFTAKRLIKFYAAYWFIFLIFVPIGIFVFDISLHQAYGQVNIPKRLVYDIFGVQMPAYNITWWFNKLIIFCYLAFPLIFLLVRKMWVVSVLSVLAIVCFKVSFGVEFNIWLIPFFIDVFYADKSKCIASFLNKHGISNILVIGLAVVGLLGFVYSRGMSVRYLSGIYADTCITLFMAVLVGNLNMSGVSKFIAPLFAALGKHSANMYMTHTFFFLYWFPNFFYSFQYAPLIFVALTAVTYAVSLLIEKAKEKIGLNSLVAKTIKSLPAIQ